ncbi:MAG: hypothetical protein WC967_00475 [Balneolaceae bacterium]
MNLSLQPERLLELVRKWWLSLILILFSWFIVKQFWWALEFNIFFAVHYKHVFGFKFIYFVMDTVTLIIHEAGHTFLRFSGSELLMILGGTIFQLLIPFLVFVFGWWNKKQYTTQLALYWLGFSWLDTAAYCADARLRQMPLLGDLPKSAHDFYNILTRLNMMEHYQIIAWSFFGIGFLVLVIAIIWPLFIRKELEHIHIDLKL